MKSKVALLISFIFLVLGIVSFCGHYSNMGYIFIIASMGINAVNQFMKIWQERRVKQ